MPRFSIITICRNEELGIRKTCDSIAKQSCRDFEWIIIDGGSTDRTLEIIDEFKDLIISIISEKDDGIYDAMNKGIAQCSGEYLIFMNGGDCFATDQALEYAATAPQKDLLYGDIFYERLGGKLSTYPDSLSQGYLLKNMVPHQATFYRRSLFETHGLYDTHYRIAADYELYIRLLEIAKVSTHHIPYPLAVFDVSGISCSKKHRSLRKQENHAIRMRYFPKYRCSLKAWRQIIRMLIQRS